ncbi:hypothetical protein JXA88_10105 [Candidatus Fermentibacteria bacterium]|nr:hypothetical protein [Candidatus Fermentibacteria bacterium]
MTATPLTQRAVARFWAPLAITWLFMAVEGPFLAAVIARLPEPTHNLAAYGVAFAIAILVEAPVIMMMSASTALVDSWRTFRRLRVFAHGLNAGITAIMLLVLVPPVYRFLTGSLLGLDQVVARLTYVSLWLLIPWPAAIGYRRFYQGLLIRAGLTRRVAYGTAVRLAGMGATALVLTAITKMAGAWIGAASLSAGVCAEALASRLMAAGPRRALKRGHRPEEALPPVPTYTQIGSFYAPLAMTMVLTMAASPMVTFFMGGAKHPLESLAVLPVVNSLVFIFRTPGVSFQEAAIALLGRGWHNLRPVLRFSLMLAATTMTGLTILVWTPLAGVWFRRVAGLSPELMAFALTSVRILVLMPALGALQAIQRAILIDVRKTRPVTGATVTELVGITAVLMVTVRLLGMTGATAAALAILLGRLAGNIYLLPPCLSACRSGVRASITGTG